jgi:hypothetical protein
MKQQRKLAALTLLALLMGTCIMIAGLVSAQSITKPSIPYFTVSVQNSDVLDIKIKNQPFDSTDELYNIYYNVREKSHNDVTWHEYYHITNQTNDNCLKIRSFSEYTEFPIDIAGIPGISIDVQVQAYIATGHLSGFNSPVGYWTWTESGWSNTQTITIPENNTYRISTPQPTHSNNPTTIPNSPNQSSPTSSTNIVVPEVNWLELGAFAILGVVVGVLLVFLVLLRKRIRVLELKQNGT